MTDSRFMLVRSSREPMIWPFQSAEEAGEWADEHGLVDYRAVEMADAEHEAVCARCREPWPCEHEKIDREVQAFVVRLSRPCAHCGEEVTRRQSQASFGGLRFHTAQSHYPGCARAALDASFEWEKKQFYEVKGP